MSFLLGRPIFRCYVSFREILNSREILFVSNKNPEDCSFHLPEDGLAFCTDPAPLPIVGHVEAPEIPLELLKKGETNSSPSEASSVFPNVSLSFPSFVLRVWYILKGSPSMPTQWLDTKKK